MEYLIKVSEENDIEALVKAGGYDWSSSYMSEFPFEETDAKAIEVIKFGKSISSEDAIKELEIQGLRPATATELLLFGIQYPEVQRTETVVALGTVRRVGDDRRVAYLYGDSSGRFLCLLGWGVNWCGLYSFAAVRK